MKKLYNNKRYFIILVFIAVIYLIYGVIGPSGGAQKESKQLIIDVLPVGKADCMVISLGECHIMIDTGERNDADSIISYCQDNEINKLDYLILTHFDKDHIGGAERIVKELTIEELYIPSYVPNKSKPLYSILSAIPKKSVHYLKMKQTISLDSMEMTIWPAENSDLLISKHVANDTEFDNDCSLITKIRYGSCGFLFMGDAEKNRIKQIRNNEEILEEMKECKWIKYPCHGKYQKQLFKLLEEIAPSNVAICARDYDSIDQKTIEKLIEYNIDYLATCDGGVRVCCDGMTISQFNLQEDDK